ncbi:Permease of the drug/metabolite transporter (DMT) superfamily [Zobellia uliginosa]|uniref:Permease of the drug/metabolite transporter (DMT) superfamily n=1 Tax=Zobellia uliginosa TaxID=143224 RepID=A0ABY1KJ51_9FLAO|nr:DMT family transporter [Zobellia uliginosa]SIS40587.1 Permease of the drug/metabolite transporter (DMT) superfamily [Zobellia uliginosa]
MSDYNKKWLYLVLLSLVWGSSFILIKKALVGLTPMQLGGLRIVFASLVLFLVGFKSVRSLKLKDWKWITWAGLLSSFFPPFLFALAQTQIDSGVTSIFNSVVPLLTTIVGVLLFGAIITKRQVLGVFIGLGGTIALIVAGMDFNPDQNYWYAIFILLSALGYALNINIVKKHLSHLSPLAVTTSSFAIAFLPALALVVHSGFFNEVLGNPSMQTSLWYLLALAVIGTSMANIFFNKLIYLSSPVFAASVTYTIPLVAISWAVLDGESLNAYQLIGGVIILLGVWMVNRKK